METRLRTRFDDRGLVVAGDGGAESERRLPFYAGAMHYWRVDATRWAACLRAMHGIGLTLVETYVPWRVHEPAPGEYEWSGRNDLAKFCAAAQAAGLGVVIRPGPHCNAELTAFGFPDHVIGDPACQARTARDTPVWIPSPPRTWPVPSYASAAFRERLRDWYAAVAEQVKDLLAPAGPIVAIGVDNEAQMFFRLGAYDHDYHPDAIAWFRELGYADAPRAWSVDDAARCAAWVRFKDIYIARSLGDFANILDDVGFAGLARFHNLPPGHHGLYDLPSIQRAIRGPVGIDAYTSRADFRDLRRRGFALAGQASPVPLALEVGVGFFPWAPPLDDDDTDFHRERDHVLTLLAAGARGFNLYMAVERERWYGAAISATGTVEKHASWIKPLVMALDEIDWPSLRRTPAIALVDTRADARFALASSAADPLTPVLSEMLGLGPAGAAELGADPGAIAARHWQTAITSALEMAQVPYVIVSESAGEDELAGYRAVIAPTGHRVDRALWATLRALADGRRSIVVIGPGTPTKDELDQPLADPPPRRVGRLKDGSPDDLPGLAVDLGALVERDDPDTEAQWTMERPEWVRAYAYADATGTVRVVFVINDRDKPAVGSLYSDVSLRDPFNHERCVSTGGKVSIGLPPRGIRMLIAD